MPTNVQVYKDPADGSWSAKVEGDEETPPRKFGSRDEAEQAGRQMAEERGGELIVHGESGKQEEKESHA